MPFDFHAQPGYDGGPGVTSPPPPFAIPGLRRWTGNRFHNARFGGEMRDDGFTSLITIHPVRAMDLLGVNSTIPGEEYSKSSGAIVFYDEEFGEPVPGNYGEFVLDATSVPPAPGNVPLSAVDPIVITVQSFANYTGDAASTLLINDEIVATDVFASGAAGLSVHTENVNIEMETWNRLVDAFDGYVTLGFRSRATTLVQGTSYVKFSLAYGAVDTESFGYINAEVTFPHRGIGFLRRGDGFVEPAAIYDPEKDRASEGPMLTVGQGWVVGDDEPDDVGTPGMTVLGLSFETPKTIEAIFAAHYAVCVTPTP